MKYLDIYYIVMIRFGVALSLFASQANAAPCKALVLSGGGNNGAWEAGVMWGLAHYGNPEDFHWDVMTGISAGSINSAMAAGYLPSEVLEMTEFMSEQWLNLTTEEFWTPNDGNFKDEISVRDTAPALVTLREIMAREKR